MLYGSETCCISVVNIYIYIYIYIYLCVCVCVCVCGEEHSLFLTLLFQFEEMKENMMAVYVAWKGRLRNVYNIL